MSRILLSKLASAQPLEAKSVAAGAVAAGPAALAPAAEAVAPVPPVQADGAEPALGRPGDRRGSLLRRFLVVADVAALCVSFIAVELAFGGLHPGSLTALMLSIPLWVLLAYANRLYHLDSFRADHRASDEIGPLLQMATLGSWCTVLALPLLGSNELPVAEMALFWGLTLVLLTAFRAGTRTIARRRPWYRQAALIIGPVAQANLIARKLRRHPEWGIVPVACVDVPRVEPSPDLGASPLAGSDGSVTVLDEADLIPLVEQLGVDRVMLAPASTESHARVETVSELAQVGVHVDLIPSWSDVIGSRLELHEMEGMPLLTVPRSPLGNFAGYLKRGFDLVVGSLALVVLSPALLACVIAIKLDSPGPVLFRQRRVGRDNRRFELLKFRSMWEGADGSKDEVAQLNVHGGGIEVGMFKIRDDPRVTRVGKLLRRRSLDELPQLFNVIRGDMSLVGPRPLIESEDRQVGGRFRRRLGITPGLTGLWQVHGRSDIPFEEMVSLDYLYVTNWSLWGDMKLLMRTVSVVARGRGAY